MASLGRVMRNAGLTTSTTLFDSTRQHISSGVLVDAAGASCGQSAARRVELQWMSKNGNCFSA
jgi:hypothetical protein